MPKRQRAIPETMLSRLPDAVRGLCYGHLELASLVGLCGVSGNVRDSVSAYLAAATDLSVGPSCAADLLAGLRLLGRHTRALARLQIAPKVALEPPGAAALARLLCVEIVARNAATLGFLCLGPFFCGDTWHAIAAHCTALTHLSPKRPELVSTRAFSILVRDIGRNCVRTVVDLALKRANGLCDDVYRDLLALDLRLNRLLLHGAPLDAVARVHGYAATLTRLTVEQACPDLESYRDFCAALADQLPRMRALYELAVGVTNVGGEARSVLRARDPPDAHASDGVSWASESVVDLRLWCDACLRFPTARMPVLRRYRSEGVHVDTLSDTLRACPRLQVVKCDAPVTETDWDTDADSVESHCVAANVGLRSALTLGGRDLVQLELGPDPEAEELEIDPWLTLAPETLASVALTCPLLEELRCSTDRKLAQTDVLEFLRSKSAHLRVFRLDQGIFYPIVCDPPDGNGDGDGDGHTVALRMPVLRELAVNMPVDRLVRALQLPEAQYVCCEYAAAATGALLRACPLVQKLHLAQARLETHPYAAGPGRDEPSRFPTRHLTVDQPAFRLVPLLAWFSGALERLSLTAADPSHLSQLVVASRACPNLTCVNYQGAWPVAHSFALCAPLLIAFPRLAMLRLSAHLLEMRVLHRDTAIDLEVWRSVIREAVGRLGALRASMPPDPSGSRIETVLVINE